MALLTCASRGMGARQRVRAIALLAPPRAPRAYAMSRAGAGAGAGGSGGGGGGDAARVAAGALGSVLRQRACLWSAELRSAAQAPASVLSSMRPRNSDGSAPLEIVEIPAVAAAAQAQAPAGASANAGFAVDAEAGCFACAVGLALPGTAAHREEAQASALKRMQRCTPRLRLTRYLPPRLASSLPRSTRRPSRAASFRTRRARPCSRSTVTRNGSSARSAW